MTFYVIYFGVPVSKNTKPEEGYGSEEWITLTSHILKCFVPSHHWNTKRVIQNESRRLRLV